MTASSTSQSVDFDGLVSAIAGEMAAAHHKSEWLPREAGPMRGPLDRLRELRRAQADLARTRAALARLMAAADAAVDSAPAARKYLSPVLADIAHAGLIPRGPQGTRA